MDVNGQAAKQAAEQFGIARTYTKEEDLLGDREVQAVYIATPVYLHAQHIRMAAEAGKHILCEKLLTLAIDEAQDSIDACRRAGVLLGVAYMMRFHSLNVEPNSRAGTPPWKATGARIQGPASAARWPTWEATA
jgi:predicted dehydrogenase